MKEYLPSKFLFISQLAYFQELISLTIFVNLPNIYFIGLLFRRVNIFAITKTIIYPNSQTT